MYLASHKGEQVLVHNTIMEQRNRFHMKKKEILSQRVA